MFGWLADLVRLGHVGELLSATVVASSLGWGDPTSERARYTRDRANGATLPTIALGHLIDAVSLVVGELAELVATTATRRPLIPHHRDGRARADDRRGPDRRLGDHGQRRGPLRPPPRRRRGGRLHALLVDGTEGRLEVTAPGHPHLAPVTVRGARGDAPLAELTLPDGYDHHPQLAGTPAHALAHAYAAIRDDLRTGTTAAPGFPHAVRRHRLLDAIQRSAAEGRRVRIGS